ncbi:hypothetical protein HUJ04_011794 [Dendroctonus ponderosae]|nr:hypothetical protein HUJ04_011794 [Dendroctonus ponderosae]
MASRRRSGSGSKRQFKEKVVQIYETILKGEEIGPNNPLFWEEFFLLKPKLAVLEAEILKLSPEQLQLAKPNLNDLFACRLFAGQTQVDNNVQAIEFLSGFDSYVANIQKLLDFCHLFLQGRNFDEYTDSIRGLCLKLIIILIIGTDNLSQSTLIEYIIMSSIFECLVKLLSDVPTRQKHGYDVVLIITLLVNYRKYDATNPYVVKLSILDDELALNGYGQVITASLTDFCNQYNVEHVENQNSSWFSSLTNMVGSMFISEEGAFCSQQIRANNALLLAFYEAVHLNRNFITTLAQTQTDASSPPSPNNTLHNNIQGLGDLPSMPVAFDVNLQPSNLLVTFFQYCDARDTKTEPGANTVKLCFLILGCISEDQYANSLMHDVSLAFKVRLHRLPMRHRKLASDKTTSSQSLVCTLLGKLRI